MNMTHYMQLLADNQPWNLLLFMAVPVILAETVAISHHEKWDGTGYPRGLKGEAIPITARLFALVDVWDALRSDRPYRKAWSRERVTSHMLGLVGTHFDPFAASKFFALVRSA